MTTTETAPTLLARIEESLDALAELYIKADAPYETESETAEAMDALAVQLTLTWEMIKDRFSESERGVFVEPFKMVADLLVAYQEREMAKPEWVYSEELVAAIARGLSFVARHGYAAQQADGFAKMVSPLARVLTMHGDLDKAYVLLRDNICFVRHADEHSQFLAVQGMLDFLVPAHIEAEQYEEADTVLAFVSNKGTEEQVTATIDACFKMAEAQLKAGDLPGASYHWGHGIHNLKSSPAQEAAAREAILTKLIPARIAAGDMPHAFRDLRYCMPQSWPDAADPLTGFLKQALPNVLGAALQPDISVTLWEEIRKFLRREDVQKLDPAGVKLAQQRLAQLPAARDAAQIRRQEIAEEREAEKHPRRVDARQIRPLVDAFVARVRAAGQGAARG